MSRGARATRTAAATAATAIALALTAVTSATGAPPPKALTHKYPLGTQTLCCQSHTVTTIRPTTPASSKPTTGHGRPAAPKKTHASHGGGLRLWLVIAVVALALAFLSLDWLAMRRSHRVAPRRRREVPPALLVALRPIFRYDAERDAWILRVRGERYGPVLAASGYHAKHPDEDDEPAPAPKTPDPFEPRPPNRPRARRTEPTDRADRTRGADDARQEREPPPLPIRPRPK
jgi:hypothetical protein